MWYYWPKMNDDVIGLANLGICIVPLISWGLQVASVYVWVVNTRICALMLTQFPVIPLHLPC